MLSKKILIIACCIFLSNAIRAQITVIKENEQRAFPKNMPAGNYSGITYIGGNEYAIVSDKSEKDGFYLFSIDIDSITGDIINVAEKAFLSDSLYGGDCEGIAYRHSTSTFYVCREADATVVELDSIGKNTGRSLSIPDVFKHGIGNYGLESLAYDNESRLFWTINESTLVCDGKQATSTNAVRNVLGLQSFSDDLQPQLQYAYMMDAPTIHSKSSEYAMGVSEIAAIGNGRLLVMEREFFVPRAKLGAFVTCKLYEIAPNESFAIAPYTPVDKMFFLPKRLVHSFTTKLNVFDRSLANYEGMCLGPTLKDGSKVLVLVSDSQNRFRGVLKDWFKTIVLQD